MLKRITSWSFRHRRIVVVAWIAILVAINLVLGGHFDIAVRDVVLSVAAFALARFEEARATSPASVADALRTGRSVTA